ncbi:unnamed protein product [Allacma fusca]|uniref:SID1 transmembrane family member 1 n=1 Tax=Allacma fusca TaxID=39272 RepID=A0A8J2KQN2_9HEXA|nr:unnamed protein product [Allacma fusca]
MSTSQDHYSICRFAELNPEFWKKRLRSALSQGGDFFMSQWGSDGCVIKNVAIDQAVLNSFIVSSSNNAAIMTCHGFDVMKAEINQLYHRSINKDEHQIFRYEFNKSEEITDPDNANLKVYAEVDPKYDDLTRKCPLHFTIRQREDVKAWELPVFAKSKDEDSQPIVIYRKVERTLCLTAGDIIKENDLIVMISTCSEKHFQYRLRVEVKYDMFIPSGEEVKKSVTLFSPTFYRFNNSGSNLDTPVMVTATSTDSTCMILSIQSPQCPLMETESTVRYAGHWQTMSFQAGITVPRDYFQSGFFIVLVILSDDSACEEYQGIVPPTGRVNYWDRLSARANERSTARSKNVSIFIRELMNEEDYIFPITLPLAFYFLLVLMVFVTFVGFHHLKLRIPKTKALKLQEEDMEKCEGCKGKLRATVFISDFVKADYRSLQKKSQQYLWSVTLVAVFYCTPVVQLIFNYVKVLYRTGEHDLCYYNFLCAHPYKSIMDFNHLYSNVGYVVLGLSFMMFVKIRHGNMVQTAELKSRQLQMTLTDKRNSELQTSCWSKLLPVQEEMPNHGVLQHFGLFYAMGVALVMEGALSASYHLCPNQTNFQYDTSFMYVISVLGVVKVYQFRHPVNVNANILLLMLAVVSIYTMFGLLFENFIFKVIFTSCYALLVFNILTYLYYVGYLKNLDDEVITSWLAVCKYVLAKWWEDLRTRHRCLPWSQTAWTLETDSNIIQLKMGPNRVLLPLLGILFNGTVITMIWTLMTETDFATQVLAMLIVNFVGYTGYYAVMKYIHNEYEGRVWLQTLVYGILAIVLWVFSLNYFRQSSTSWDKSPAKSKVQNRDCFFINFYDEHDMWHFLSAGAMFCSFMVLFTLDDDLIFTPQTRIPVF